MKNISDHDVGELLRTSIAQRGGKPAKYIALGEYRETIVKLMNLNVQLNLIRDWLVEKQGEQLVVNTLRKYIVRNIGREFYDEYLKRNGWTKTRRNSQPGAQSHEEPNTFGGEGVERKSAPERITHRTTEHRPRPATATTHESRAPETDTTTPPTVQATKPAGMTQAAWIAEQVKRQPKKH